MYAVISGELNGRFGCQAHDQMSTVQPIDLDFSLLFTLIVFADFHRNAVPNIPSIVAKKKKGFFGGGGKKAAQEAAEQEAAAAARAAAAASTAVEVHVVNEEAGSQVS
jgi:hypothetical protein